MKKYEETELRPEEILLDSSGRGFIEKQLSFWAFRLVIFLELTLGVILVMRLFNLTLFNYNYFRGISLANTGREISTVAPRGIIYDRFGEPLVENIPSFKAFINRNEFYKIYKTYEERKEFLDQVAKILEVDVRSLEAGLKESGFYNFLIPNILSKDQLIAIKEFNSRALDVQSSYRRQYLHHEVTSHVLGYVGIVNNNDLAKNDYLKINDDVGRAGLEFFYDEILRGEEGKRQVVRDSRGNIIDTLREVPPKSGEILKTTLDLDFQNYFFNRLKEGLASLGRRSAVGLAMNPQNGEIIALISLPSFDNNVFGNNNEAVRKILNDKNKPLFNRAVGGLYNPASTIKPLHAFAALKEGVIDTNKSIFSKGYIELPNPYNPESPSRFVDWKPNGWVNVYSALAKSSNIYFYSVGGGFEDVSGLGISRLANYWDRWGYGKKTGIDLPYEGEGFLPNPEEKEERTNQIWRIGDTYNVSIGQGDLLVTPLQLLSQISALANGGKFYRPHMTLVDSKEIEPTYDYSDSREIISEIKRGMTHVVTKDYGTAHLLNTLPMAVAGKTGSAQVSNNTKTNAIFVGYIDSENPELAILILVEDAKEGSLNTIPIAYDVFEWYYWNRIQK